MPISHGDYLFALIRSLTKAEKRNFRLYARRIQGEGDLKFLHLFDVLEKQTNYNEEVLLRKLKGTSKSQFSNLKRHLYQHILTSLRLVQLGKKAEIQVREWIDYADVLYGKGLYIQALKLLTRAKTLAININNDLLHLEIVEYEKRIESRHITRSSTERMEGLTEEAVSRSNISKTIVELSNFKLILQRRFINDGHVKNPVERLQAEAFFRNSLPRTDRQKLTFFEKVYLYQTYYWQHYLLQEYDQCLEYAQNWISLYDNDPRMIQPDVDMFLIGMHHVLITAFYCRNYPVFSETLQRLENYRQEHYHRLDYNSKILSFLFVHQARFNRAFIDGNIQDALRLIPRTLGRIKRYADLLDPHKVLIFYYKIACTYLIADKPGLAIDFLNKILNAEGKALREDLQAYTQLLFIMAHYDLGNFDLLDYRIQNAARFVQRMKDPSLLQKTMVQHFRELLRSAPPQRHQALQAFLQKVEALRAIPTEQRSFIFLDPAPWMLGKLHSRPLSVIIQERFAP
jgi:tetratricopeptide (TPR) repeat protein